VTKKNSSERPLRVGLISLGCAKNLVDAEIMLGSLLKSGVEITNDAAQADAVIVNTCSFIDSAQEESVDTILESVELREAANRGQAVIVSGCLPQRFRDELPKLMPEVDAFMGIDQVAQVGDIVNKALECRAGKVGKHSTFNIQHPTSKGKISVRLNELEKGRTADEHEKENAIRSTNKLGKTRTVVSSYSALRTPHSALLDVTSRPTFIPDFETPRFRLTPKHFAYLKIAEGCNHPCSFCIIPRMRGSHRSRTQTDIVKEAKALIADGVKEINLISQDSTYYGLDLRPAHSGTGVPSVSFNPQKTQYSPNHTGGTPVPLRLKTTSSNLSASGKKATPRRSTTNAWANRALSPRKANPARRCHRCSTI
jgi:ribosomal protein S12 methylthiotransferase